VVRSSVLGIDCFAGDLDSATTAVITRALSGEGGFACLANVHVLVTAQRDPQLHSALAGAWADFPDGAPVAWLLRRAGGARAHRIAGPDLMPAVIERGQGAGLRHFLFGSTPSVLRALELRLVERFSEVQIVGTWAPNYGEESSSDSLQRIREAEPHLVWVALGAPKQELWMARHIAELHPTVAIGVGAAFDFQAGLKTRAPRWMQRTSLEWLHRLASEPRRLWWRYVSTNSVFVFRALRELAHR
jgi:N-acetylglucosaminyldiphosphoundecaprenol N-acetyl-beta-D-mannosaminyltransferase